MLLRSKALDDGIESSDYVKFVTNNMTTDDNKGFKEFLFTSWHWILINTQPATMKHKKMLIQNA